MQRLLQVPSPKELIWDKELKRTLITLSYLRKSPSVSSVKESETFGFEKRDRHIDKHPSLRYRNQVSLPSPVMTCYDATGPDS